MAPRGYEAERCRTTTLPAMAADIQSMLGEAHSTGLLAGTKSPQQWGDGTHSQAPLGMGPDETRQPVYVTVCFEVLPSSWEDVLAAWEGLGVGL